MGFNTRPCLIQSSKSIVQGHITQSQQDNAMAGPVIAEDQFAEVFISRWNHPIFDLGADEPIGIRRARLGLRRIQRVVAEVTKTDHNESGQLFIGKEPYSGFDPLGVNRLIH